MSDTEMNDNTDPTTKTGLPAAKSIQGYVLIATNIHEEATEEDVMDLFSEWGRVRSLHLNLERQSGYVQGYALVEYRELEEAQEAVSEGNGAELLDRIIAVDYAFVDLEKVKRREEQTEREEHHQPGYKPRAARERERSPERRR